MNVDTVNEFRFECQKCGSCCSNKTEGNTYIGIEELYRLSQNLDLSLKDLLDNYIEIREEIFHIENEEIKFKVFIIRQNNGKCVFLQDSKCMIYKFRPFLCRHYPFLNSILNNESNLMKYKSICKGFGRGKIFTEKKIEQKLNEDYKFLRKLYKNSNYLKSLKIDQIMDEIKLNLIEENQSIEESALELIKKELLIETIEHYFLNRND